jgi:hypothetical protein
VAEISASIISLRAKGIKGFLRDVVLWLINNLNVS